MTIQGVGVITRMLGARFWTGRACSDDGDIAGATRLHPRPPGDGLAWLPFMTAMLCRTR
jgi:hypothetical protein